MEVNLELSVLNDGLRILLTLSLSGLMVSTRCHCGVTGVLSWLPLVQLCWSCVIHLVPPHFRTRLKHLYLDAVESM